MLLDDFELHHSPSTEADAVEQLRPYIQGEVEQLYWAGQPKQGFFFRKQDGCFVPFFWATFLFSVLWESLAIWGDANWFMILWGIPFVLVTGHMAIGRHFHDWWYRKRVYYGLTPEKLYILRGNRLDTHVLTHINDLVYVERWGDYGDIILQIQSSNDKQKYSTTLPSAGDCLDCVPRAKALYDWMLEHATS